MWRWMPKPNNDDLNKTLCQNENWYANEPDAVNACLIITQKRNEEKRRARNGHKAILWNV